MGGLSDLKSYGEPGAVVYLADCVELMRLRPPECVDAIFADPPYRLSGGGVTVKSGHLAPVAKGKWDRSKGFGKDLEWNVRALLLLPAAQGAWPGVGSLEVEHPSLLRRSRRL